MFLRNILHKGKARLASIATILVAIALPVVFTTTSMTASADSFCNDGGGDGYCMITQGSYVTVCQNLGSCYTPNFDWQFLNAGSGFSEIYSPNYNSCIGDLYNSSTNAHAGLAECPTQGSAGWGTKMWYANCTNGLGSGYEFWDYHWSAWIGTAAFKDGSPYYLNDATTFCFHDDPYV